MLNLDLWKLLLDLKSITSDILRYVFEPAEWDPIYRDIF